MSVPVDDSDSYNDLQLDFSRKNHAFNLDNVGYISKELNETRGKICSVTHSTFKMCSENGGLTTGHLN